MLGRGTLKLKLFMLAAGGGRISRCSCLSARLPFSIFLSFLLYFCSESSPPLPESGMRAKLVKRLPGPRPVQARVCLPAFRHDSRRPARIESAAAGGLSAMK